MAKERDVDQTERIFIKLLIYNYDASSRYQYLEHKCKSVADAKRKASRLKRMAASVKISTGGGNWLQRNHQIYGFVQQVEGIFCQTTTRID